MNARYTETIVWVPLTVELPDEEIKVLGLLANGDVWECHLREGRWRRTGGKTPVAWAHWPTGDPDQQELSGSEVGR